MSLTGARLRFDLPIDLPSNFSLQLTRDGKCLRPCSLIWSDDCERQACSFHFHPRSKEVIRRATPGSLNFHGGNFGLGLTELRPRGLIKRIRGWASP